MNEREPRMAIATQSADGLHRLHAVGNTPFNLEVNAVDPAKLIALEIFARHIRLESFHQFKSDNDRAGSTPQALCAMLFCHGLRTDHFNGLFVPESAEFVGDSIGIKRTAAHNATRKLVQAGMIERVALGRRDAFKVLMPDEPGRSPNQSLKNKDLSSAQRDSASSAQRDESRGADDGTSAQRDESAPRDDLFQTHTIYYSSSSSSAAEEETRGDAAAVLRKFGFAERDIPKIIAEHVEAFGEIDWIVLRAACREAAGKPGLCRTMLRGKNGISPQFINRAKRELAAGGQIASPGPAATPAVEVTDEMMQGLRENLRKGMDR